MKNLNELEESGRQMVEAVEDAKHFEILKSFGLSEDEAFQIAIERPAAPKPSIESLLKFFS